MPLTDEMQHDDATIRRSPPRRTAFLQVAIEQIGYRFCRSFAVRMPLLPLIWRRDMGQTLEEKKGGLALGLGRLAALIAAVLICAIGVDQSLSSDECDRTSESLGVGSGRRGLAQPAGNAGLRASARRARDPHVRGTRPVGAGRDLPLDRPEQRHRAIAFGRLVAFDRDPARILLRG